MKFTINKSKKNLVPVFLLSSLTIAISGCGSDSSPEQPIEDTLAPVITITGGTPVNVDHNGSYADEGATATDNVDGTVSVTSDATVDSVNTTTVGSYEISYTATDAAGNEASVTRTINVVDNTAPVITVTGDTAITVFQNSTYVDQDATATDAVDATVDVATSGAVNTAVTGDYELTYTATDAAGNESTAVRTITVIPATLSGTAAGGAAIVGTVVVKGANGNVKSAVIEADGTYEVDVTGLTAPYRLRAEGTVGGKHYKLHSYTEEASVGGTVNITPFTDLIIANTAQQLAANFFDSTVDTGLDASLTLYEEADLLIIKSLQHLKTAEDKIEVLIKSRQGGVVIDDNGTAKTKDF